MEDLAERLLMKAAIAHVLLVQANSSENPTKHLEIARESVRRAIMDASVEGPHSTPAKQRAVEMADAMFGWITPATPSQS